MRPDELVAKPTLTVVHGCNFEIGDIMLIPSRYRWWKPWTWGGPRPIAARVTSIDYAAGTMEILKV